MPHWLSPYTSQICGAFGRTVLTASSQSSSLSDQRARGASSPQVSGSSLGRRQLITGVAPAELSRVDLGEYRQFRWGLDTFGVERVRAWGSGSVGSWSYVHCAGFVALRHGDARGVGVVRIRATGEGRAAEVEVYPDPKAARQGLLGGYRPFDIDMLLTW